MKNIFLVDVDDTILDFHGASALALQSAFEGSGLAFDEKYLTEFKRINGGLWEALERKELTRKELIERRFHIYLAEMGIEGVDGDAFNRLFLEYLATHPIYIDGAKEFLTKLKKMGWVYFVTNGTAWIQKSRFDIAALWGYAEDTFVSETVGYDKPSKKYTEYVMAHIPNFKRENAVWIGDSLSADIKGANASNISSIWFNPHKKSANGDVQPNYTAESFDEILTILKKGF